MLKPGEVRRTEIPDSFDGIRFEIKRLQEYVIEYRKDPLVLETAHRIANLSMDAARQLKRKPLLNEQIWLEGIHAWGHANFEHVSNPANIELIKTPAKMLRELSFSEEAWKTMWEPIRDAMAKADGVAPETLKIPKPRITGTSGVSTTLVLTLAAALGLQPLTMRFGGHDGILFYLWARVFASGEEFDVDILQPKFNEHRKFQHYEDLELPMH